MAHSRHGISLLTQHLRNYSIYNRLEEVTDRLCRGHVFLHILMGNTNRSLLQGPKLNMFCRENWLFSLRALVRGIPANVKLAPENIQNVSDTRDKSFQFVEIGLGWKCAYDW